MSNELERVAIVVQGLSHPGQDERAAAVRDLTVLLAEVHLAGAQQRLLALAEEVIKADGILPLLHMVQCVDFDLRRLRPCRKANPVAAVYAQAANDVCALLCDAAAGVLDLAGWSLIKAPEDGRPAYLHRASGTLRNTPPDVPWPQDEGVNADGGKTWAQQLLLDLPTLVVPIKAEAPARRQQRSRRSRGFLRWPVKVVEHVPGSHSVLDVIVDGQADCLFRQLIRHDVAGAWRHTEGTVAVEISLGGDGRPSPSCELLSWSKVTMALVPLLLRTRGAAGQPQLSGPTGPRLLVLGTSSCCDLLGFFAHYLPCVQVDDIEASGIHAAARREHLVAHFGLSPERCNQSPFAQATIAETLQALAEGRGKHRYDIVAMDLASEPCGSLTSLLAAAADVLSSNGLMAVSVGSDRSRAREWRQAAKSSQLSLLAELSDAGARGEDATAETALLLVAGGTGSWHPKLVEDGISAEAWEAALHGDLGSMLKQSLPMKIDSVEQEGSDAEEDAGENPRRLWLFWGEGEQPSDAPKTALTQVAESDEAWDIFGGKNSVSPRIVEVPQAAPEPSSAEYWTRLLPAALLEQMVLLLHGSAFCSEQASARQTAAGDVALPAGVTTGELQAQLLQNGYATCPGPEHAGSYAELVPWLHEAVAALAAQGLPPVFVYMYDAAWEFVLRLWPVVEAILGGPCVLEPSFAAFRLDFAKSSTNRRYVGNNFPKPHRDYSPADSIDSETGALKVLSVWVPLNKVTLSNGCIYVVPKHKDTNFADPISREGLQEPAVPEDGVTPLAPHPAGTFMCWSGNTIHWGSACERKGANDPRSSMAFVFRRCGWELTQVEASLAKEDALLPLREGCGPRLKRVARAVHFFSHWYPVPEPLQRLLGAAGEAPRGVKRSYE